MDKVEHKISFKKNKCCVIVPTYNNQKSIKEVVTDVLAYCDEVYVVNDGSTDTTLSLLLEFGDSIRLISYPTNVGKGNALNLGFKQAYKDGFDYAITIDSDGQHYASDLPIFLEAIEKEPNSMLIGERKLDTVSRSKGSSFANKFSNFWFAVETGTQLADTQSGYRLYPLKDLGKMRLYTKKYEFEIESIVRLSWKGVTVKNVPINVFYPSREERVSHFRPFKDFFRISVLNTILVTLAFLFFLHRNIVRQYKKKSFKEIMRTDVFKVGAPIHITALSIGFGVFMGIFPIWGYQLVVGLLFCHIFKLNKALFFIFANISLPPMIPVILYASFVMGGYVLGDGHWALSINSVSFETIKNDLVQYLVGAVSLSILAGVLFWLGAYVILHFATKKNRG